MKKIIIITPYWLNTKGGITTVVYNLYNELKKKYDVTLLTPDEGREIIHIPKNRKNPIAIAKTIILIKNENPDIIHVHGHGSLLLSPILYKLLFKKNTKIFFTFHTQPHSISFFGKKSNKKKERKTFVLFLLNCLLKYCDANTYVSQNLMECLKETGIKGNNPIVIYNGVTEKKVTEKEIYEFKKKYKIKDERDILCMIANLSWDWKIEGIKILINAINKINGKIFNPLLLIIGDGKYKKYIDKYAKKTKKGKDIIFTGNMNNPFIALTISDIYCHISLNESFGVAILEAMSINKPVIASDDGGIPEIIKNNINGILVKSTKEEVAKAILLLHKDHYLAKKISKNGITTVKNKFSWDKICKEYIKLYEPDKI